MTNETMTDARADEVFAAILGQAMQGTDARAAYENIAVRLRGEAAPEGRAVAWAVTREGDATFPRLYTREADADDMVNYVTLPPRPAKRPLVFGDRPQPAPVAGDAVAFERWMDRDWPLWRNDPSNPNVGRLRRLWDALAQDRASLAGAAGGRA